MPAPPGSLLDNEIGAPPPVKSNPPVSAGAPTPTFPPHPFFPLCFQSTTTSTKPEKDLFRPYTHPPFSALRKKSKLDLLNQSTRAVSETMRPALELNKSQLAARPSPLRSPSPFAFNAVGNIEKRLDPRNARCGSQVSSRSYSSG
ncbi:unnamed protein product [Calypogeia fissa]